MYVTSVSNSSRAAPPLSLCIYICLSNTSQRAPSPLPQGALLGRCKQLFMCIGCSANTTSGQWADAVSTCLCGMTAVIQAGLSNRKGEQTVLPTCGHNRKKASAEPKGTARRFTLFTIVHSLPAGFATGPSHPVLTTQPPPCWAAMPAACPPALPPGSCNPWKPPGPHHEVPPDPATHDAPCCARPARGAP